MCSHASRGRLHRPPHAVLNEARCAVSCKSLSLPDPETQVGATTPGGCVPAVHFLFSERHTRSSCTWIFWKNAAGRLEPSTNRSALWLPTRIEYTYTARRRWLRAAATAAVTTTTTAAAAVAAPSCDANGDGDEIFGLADDAVRAVTADDCLLQFSPRSTSQRNVNNRTSLA